MTHQPIGPIRVVKDGWTLRVWTVSERRTTIIEGHRAALCLEFRSKSTIRRVWTYPLQWFELCDAALLALSEAAYTGFTTAFT
jgi:hypothetical protein